MLSNYSIPTCFNIIPFKILHNILDIGTVIATIAEYYVYDYTLFS